MRRYFFILTCFFCLGVFVHPGKTVQAQGAGQGLMNAISYKALPQNTAFNVKTMDNSNQNVVLKEEFEFLLKSKGFSISKDAPMVITFETRSELGTYTTHNRRSVLELEARGGREGGENARMRFNLFDSNSGGMFNQGKGETSLKTPGQYRLDVSIVNRTNGKHHWQAWTTANQDSSDSGALVLAMVPEMVNKMGEKVKSHVFDLF
jgi:hypothetical protein